MVRVLSSRSGSMYLLSLSQQLDGLFVSSEIYALRMDLRYCCSACPRPEFGGTVAIVTIWRFVISKFELFTF